MFRKNNFKTGKFVVIFVAMLVACDRKMKRENDCNRMCVIKVNKEGTHTWFGQSGCFGRKFSFANPGKIQKYQWKKEMST